ncbi:hypothetical protein TrRE_jg4331 [Triparma retinervis]|uniref:Uncharacterized protein n=1 Tax=Triparma retinervis TaxID=2557542 RepID=A0A9W7G205_9STRA|nr:hypothetical protein TrRE_jg4331 [Triparma retinervis]
MTTKKESVFHRYTVPKRKKPSFVDPACSPPSAKRSTIVVPRVTSVRDKTWRLRNYDGVQCMVITLSAAEKQVTVRTSDMAKGMKIPSAGDSHIRDWTRTLDFADDHAALQFATSSLNTALDDNFTEGTCPRCGGPGRYTEAQLSEKVGLLRSAKADGRGVEALCRKCAKDLSDHASKI